jgi:hypothetical protein
MKQVRDPSHLPAVAEAERPVPEYEYTKDIILTIRGKAYDVRIQKIKDSESY